MLKKRIIKFHVVIMLFISAGCAGRSSERLEITPTVEGGIVPETVLREEKKTVSPTRVRNTVTPLPSPTPETEKVESETFPDIPGTEISNFPGWIAVQNAGRGQNGIGLIRPDGGEYHLIYHNNVDGPVSWSPDSRWLIFHAAAAPEYSEIFKISRGGDQLDQLTQYYYSDIYPSWSPDGETIVYTVNDENGRGDLVIKNLATGQKKQITYTKTDEEFPTWFPDGESIAYLSSGDENVFRGSLMMVIPRKGGQPEVVNEDIRAAGPLSISPDGEKITFASYGIRNCGDIYTVDADGSALKKITDLPGCATSPSWSPTGAYIAFLNSDQPCCGFDAEWQIFIISNDGSQLYRHPTRSGWAPLSLSWSPVPALRVGQTYRITELGDHLNLREDPNLEAEVVDQLRSGEIITVLEGPIQQGRYYWFQLQTADEQVGWAVDSRGWYQPGGKKQSYRGCLICLNSS